MMSAVAAPRVNSRDQKPDALEQVARELLDVPLGARIPTVQQLQACIGVGSGTVVKALRTLEERGAASTEAHGHLGTLLIDHDLGQLWELGRMGNLRVLMTPPGPVEQHAVAAAVRQAMSERDVPVLLDFVPGASRRLKLVATGKAQATVTSRGAFTQHEREYPALSVVDLGDHTYYDRGTLVVVSRTQRLGTRPRRVGIDASSDDHVALTRAEFGQDVEVVACSFVHGPAGVLNGDFDAVIWHRMPAIIPPELAGLAVRALSIGDADPGLGQLSRAVLVHRRSDVGVGGLLAAVSPTRVRQHLRRLNTAVGGSLLPHEALWLG